MNLLLELEKLIMVWIKALAVDALETNTRQVVKLEERSLLLLNESGNIYAIDSICPHLKLPLKKGKITSDGSIVCPWHRSEFELATGQRENLVSIPSSSRKCFGKNFLRKDPGCFSDQS